MRKRANRDGLGLFGAELADVDTRVREAREGWCWACGAPATRVVEVPVRAEQDPKPRMVGACAHHGQPEAAGP